MTTDSNDRSALAWLAYCYLSDELAPPDRAAFDRRLAEDQAAREALAEVVRLSEAVRALPEAAFQASPAFGAAASSRWSPLVWAALGAAACLVVTLAGQALWKQRLEVGPPSPHAEQLALAWVESRAAESDAVEQLAEAAADFEIDDELTSEGDEPGSAPSWLLEALQPIEEMET